MMKILPLLLIIAAALGCGRDAPKNYKIVNPFICSPGSHFKIDCNNCWCGPTPGADGPCTRMACFLEEGKCIPSSYFRIDKKLCECPQNGCKWDSKCFAHNSA